MEVKNSTQKKDIQDSSPFCRFFDYGASNEGYWNFNHAALQLEDLVDCLIVLFPNVDFVFLFDQSSGHGKRQKDGLSMNLMNRGWGSAGPIMHSTQIEPACLGPYPKMLKVGDVQTMTFGEEDDGPFDLTEQQRRERKHDKWTGNKKKRPLRKAELVDLMQAKIGASFISSTYRSMEDLYLLAGNHGIATTIKEDEVIPGWLGKSKGLLQILWMDRSQ